MKPWNAAPLLRILLPLILGISAAILTPVDIPHLNHLLIVLFSLLFLMLIFPALKSYKNSWYYGCILNVLLVSIGFQLTREKMDQHSTAHFSKHLKNTTWIHARIDKAIVEKEKSVKAIVQILSVDGKPTEIVFGKAIVYFQKDERALHLNYGDEIVLKKEFKEIPPARNPGTFDYKRWLFYKNITQQAFLKKQQWVYMGKNSGNTIIAYSIRIRNELLNILKQAQLKDDELAMASALLLGYTNTLEQDLISAYAQTGALHILSVSGLHVGIVFIVLNTLLSFLDKFKYGLCLKTLLLITALWCYAFISGLSPSVMRAAIMLSFIVYAKSFKKNSSIYNTLAASALFLLLYDPFYLVDVGFQLSYLAVLGIAWIHPFFAAAVKTDRWFVQQFTSLITVSIAAQLATFPISIYYFHQFPNYFLLTNLVAIPLSTGIIYLGIALMTCAGNHFLLHHLSTFFSAAVKFLNTCIRWISELPYSITDGIYIGTFELWGMYLSVIFLMLFLYKKGIHYLKFFLWSIIAILCIQFIQMIQLQNQRKLNVYALSKASAVDLIDGMKHVVVIDSANEKAMAGINELHPYWESLKLNAPLYATTSLQTSSVCVRDEAIQFYDKQIVILKSMEKTTHLFNKNCYLKVDYVILSNNVKLSIDEIIKIYQPGCIIFDSSSRNYFLKKWRDECEACHQKYYNLNDEGAFLSEF